MEVDDSGYPKVHQTLEFFEMCANLITALARWSGEVFSTECKQVTVYVFFCVCGL